jgi:hypothetical protein
MPWASPERLKPLLRNRRWNNRFATAVIEQFGDKVLFETLYSFLTDTNRSTAAYADQTTAAEQLVRYQPLCSVSLEKAISETLSRCDEAVQDWPLCLWHCFGRDKVRKELERLKAGTLTEKQSETIEIWHYWSSGD